MKAKIKRLHSPDIPDLERYVPERTDMVGFLLQVFAGPSGEDGEESFDLIVCTPAWLAARLQTESVRFGRNHLLIRQYDYSEMVAALRHAFEEIEGESWSAVAVKLGRYAKWEFDDYSERPT